MTAIGQEREDDIRRRSAAYDRAFGKGWDHAAHVAGGLASRWGRGEHRADLDVPFRPGQPERLESGAYPGGREKEAPRPAPKLVGRDFKDKAEFDQAVHEANLALRPPPFSDLASALAADASRHGGDVAAAKKESRRRMDEYNDWAMETLRYMATNWYHDRDPAYRVRMLPPAPGWMTRGQREDRVKYFHQFVERWCGDRGISLEKVNKVLDNADDPTTPPEEWHVDWQKDKPRKLGAKGKKPKPDEIPPQDFVSQLAIEKMRLEFADAWHDATVDKEKSGDLNGKLRAAIAKPIGPKANTEHQKRLLLTEIAEYIVAEARAVFDADEKMPVPAPIKNIASRSSPEGKTLDRLTAVLAQQVSKRKGVTAYEQVAAVYLVLRSAMDDEKLAQTPAWETKKSAGEEFADAFMERLLTGMAEALAKGFDSDQSRGSDGRLKD